MSISSKALAMPIKVCSPFFGCQDFEELKLTPVIIFASDLSEKDIAKSKAVEYFLKVLSYSQAWFKDKVKKTFYLKDTIILKSNKSAADWNYLVNQLMLEGHRYDYHYPVIDELVKAGLKGGWDGTTYNKYIAVVYTGKQKHTTFGASASELGGGYMIITPISTKKACPQFSTKNKPAIDSDCASAVRQVCHEIGHALGGLIHSCDNIPKPVNCENSFMQGGFPPNMMMLPFELKAMEESLFFR